MRPPIYCYPRAIQMSKNMLQTPQGILRRLNAMPYAGGREVQAYQAFGARLVLQRVPGPGRLY